jgi:hypothetical protein
MGKNKGKKKFTSTWSNQTDLGKELGLSAIAVGKLLIEAGLKDSSTKLATEKALKEGYAKSTLLKDGTPYFMWNIEKVRPLISKDHKQLSKVDYWVNEVLEIGRETNRLADDGQDKLACIMIDCAFDDVPEDIVGEVRAKVVRIEEVGGHEKAL